MQEDKILKYLEKHFQEKGTINDILRDEIVDFEGEKLKIGAFMVTIRRQHSLFIKGRTDRGCSTPLALSRYKALDKMDFIWEPSIAKQQELQENDPCLDFVTAYYDKYKTYEGLPETIKIDGISYSIKAFISHVRTNHKRYISGDNKKGSNSKTALRRYAALDERNFEWEPKKRTSKDDRYIRFLKQYFQEHQTIENVPKKVVFEGEELNIENFFEDRRKKHRRKEMHQDYKPSELESKRWEALDEMNYDWNQHEKRKQELMENDPYICYLKEHYKTHGTINDITAKQEVEFKGQILKIGAFINDCRKKHHAYTTKKIKASSIASPLALKRYAELTALEIDWRPSETNFSVEKHAREHGVNKKTLKKYITKFGGNVDKATKICQAARRYNSQIQQRNSKNGITLGTVMQEFEVDIHTLMNLLYRKTAHEKTTPEQPLMYDEKTNLRDFCIDNGLNYGVIQKAIKLKRKGLCDEDLQSLINRTITEYNKKGQKRPSTWIYSKYGNEALVRHLLLSMHLSPESILVDMSKNGLTLEEAIENNCFERNSSKDFEHLKPLYHDMISFYNKVNHSSDYTPETAPDAIIGYFQMLVDEYQLTEEEFTIIRKSFVQYSDSIETYKLYNVGFEKDPKKKVEKIIAYQFDEDEIEEAFFMPLRFDQKVLLGRDSELYQRRALLKNLTVDWNNLSLEQRQEKTDTYFLTGEELKYITQTRCEIDAVKAKVKEK